MNINTFKILLFLFAINSITLYLYFSSHPDYFHHKGAENHSHVTNTRSQKAQKHFQFRRSFSAAKPWPILPSYLPWSQNRDVPFRSCEGYFGSSFTRRVDALKPSPESRRDFASGSGGWFRCLYSDTLRSSICEAGRLRMNADKILMSRGGEKLETVVGRGEGDELPAFQAGAFDIEVTERSRFGKKLVNNEFLDKYVEEGDISRHTMRSLIDSIRLVGPNEFQCSEWVEEPTLLVTRFEYANLFHTVTDWYSAYVASRVTALPSRPHLVFVDGHCEAPLEQTWNAFFSSLRYAKSFSGFVCFRHAILVPLGYETALFKGLTEDIDCQGAAAQELWQHPDDHKTARLSEFGEMIRAAFGFPVDRHHISRPVSGHNVLFVRREDYLAHPRHGGKVQSRLSNEQEVFDSVKSWASNHSVCELNVVNGLFAHMPMKEQVRAIQDASVIIGAHGAGLTHIVSATPNTTVLEIISSEYRRPHFALIAKWKGLEYHAIHLDGHMQTLEWWLKNLVTFLKVLIVDFFMVWTLNPSRTYDGVCSQSHLSDLCAACERFQEAGRLCREGSSLMWDENTTVEKSYGTGSLIYVV